MQNNFCAICEVLYATQAEYETHLRQHQVVEKLPAEDSNFIPHVEIDPVTLKAKPRPYQQQPWQSATDYGG